MIKMIRTQSVNGLCVGDTVMVQHDWDIPRRGKITSISNDGLFARIKKSWSGKTWHCEYNVKDLVKVDDVKNDFKTILANFCNEVKKTKIKPDSIDGVLIADNKITLYMKNRKVLVSETLTASHFLRYFGDRHSIIA